MMQAGEPLCSGGCNDTQCNTLWSYVWSTKPQGQPSGASASAATRVQQVLGVPTQRRRLQSDCQCAQTEVDYSLKHVGVANISWPPGLGHWFSTPAAGECAEGAPLGANGCAWRRHPHARLIYGYELVEAGFVREDGPSVHGQTLVDLDVHLANAKAFAAVFAKHPVEPEPLCRAAGPK
jgi:hypothetical protein